MRSIGQENFSKEILFKASSSEEMFAKEQELVEVNDHTYNLKAGGYGGWDHLSKEKVKEFGYLGGVKTRDLKLGIFKERVFASADFQKKRRKKEWKMLKVMLRLKNEKKH